MTISDRYQATLRELHAGRRPDKKWGTTGARNFGDHVCKFLEHRRGFIHSVLDFGAGQQSLGKYVQENGIDLRVAWDNYDPGIPEIDTIPKDRYDAVVSSDVLEHVEPEEIDSTVDQLFGLAAKAQYHHIACDPCGLTLPDGRNAHLITEPLEWWLEKFDRDGWTVMYAADLYERKRSGLRRSCHIMIEKDGA